MTGPERTRLAWVAKPGEVLKGAPPLWAREHEGRVVEVAAFRDAAPGQDSTQVLARLGWFEAVDAEGRSR